MKALIAYGNGDLGLHDNVAMPKLGDYDCLVQNIACGICNGTDLKLKAAKLRHFDTYPAIIGHESTGVIVQTGRKVRYYKEHDIVLRSGLENTSEYYSLWGGFAEFGRVVDCRAMAEDGVSFDEGLITQQIIPSKINPVDAIMLITLKEIYSALDRLAFKEGIQATVAGDGPVGLALAQLIKLRGAAFVALSGHHDDRLEAAVRLGADVVTNSLHKTLQTALHECQIDKLDAYVDAVGRMGNLTEALQVIKEDGTIALYGIGLERNQGIDWYAGPYNWRIHSVQWPLPRWEHKAHDAVIKLVLDGKINLKDYVTHQLPIANYAEGFHLVENRKALKVALTF